MNFNKKHKGCLAELKAKTWLLRQGYEVFENISTHGEVDLILYDPVEYTTTLVDVTTGTYYLKEDGSKTLQYAKNKLKKKEIIQILVYIEETEEFFFVRKEGE